MAVGELPGRVKSGLLAVTLYKDRSGLLTTESNLSTNSSNKKKGPDNRKQKQDLDDEDELLYGSSEVQVGMFMDSSTTGASADAEETQEANEGWRKHYEPVKTTFWFIGIRQNGNFELYSVPDFTLR